jgi:hypothetical protein
MERPIGTVYIPRDVPSNQLYVLGTVKQCTIQDIDGERNEKEEK